MNQKILQSLGVLFLLVFAGVGVYTTSDWLSYREDVKFINNIDQQVAVMQNTNDDAHL